jgi:hypothetical protein
MPLQNRALHFGDTSVLLQYAGERSARIIEFLYSRLARHGTAEPRVTFHIVPGVEADELSLYRGGRLLYDGASAGQLANQLMSDSLYHLADKCCGGMLIHAAAAARGGRVLLMPGTTGAGKTSLSVWLMQSGFDYLTDELVYIGEGSISAQGFTRPLNVKTRARDAVGQLFDFEANRDAVLNCEQAVLVPPESVGSVADVDTMPLGAILFPRFEANAELALRRLSPAQTGLRLMSCLINARNLAGHGFPEATRIARLVPAHELIYGDYEQLDAAISELHGTLLESAA